MYQKRKILMKRVHASLFVISLLLLNSYFIEAQNSIKPNIILIITDDQGYGDLGINGNPHINTPVIDKLASESVVFNNFYVTPVCATTRSGLMTGRYNLRTGIRDTYNGGAMMASSEVTIAEMLKEVNYTTGIFGKWHLGDNYPSRPMDQGFDESVIHLSGGMGQVGDVTTYFQFDSSYYNPVLWHNGKQEPYAGYCSDIFTQEAISFIEKNKDTPFFCYLSFNAPHTPLQVPDEYYQKYENIDPTAGFNDGRPFPEMTEKDKEDARKVYAMVENIDDNIGRLTKKLQELKIDENTIIIFMTDNGPQQRRYVAGMKGRKGSVYRGGVRVPFYMKYPGANESTKIIEATACNIDVLPTIADICGAQVADDRMIDGKSLVPILQGKSVNWEDRSLFFYWTRRYPELYSNMAIQQGKYKLVGNTSYDASIDDFELFDIREDPYELNNLVPKSRDVALKLKEEMDKTYQELISSQNILNPPRIIVGSEENPTILNRNDADGDRGIWAQEEIFGKWRVEIVEGLYNVKFKFLKPIAPNGKMLMEIGPIIHKTEHAEGSTDVIEMKNVKLPDLECEIIPFYQIDGKRIFPFWVEMEKVG
jgi:arylsulfatase A-like enzyme